MSDFMSDMKVIAKFEPVKKPARRARKPAKPKQLPTVFTVRELNRETAKVLAASKQHGRVAIRSRKGEEFTIAPAPDAAPPGSSTFAERIRLHWARLREAGCEPMDDRAWELMSRAIAGE